MTLAFAGACTHSPSITARPAGVQADVHERLEASFGQLRTALNACEPEVLIVIAPEHYSNFFLDNMPAFAIGMADVYEGPTEDESWLKLARRRVPGARAVSEALVPAVLETVDVAFCEEWLFDHGTAVPLHYLTPQDELPIVLVHVNCQHPPLPPLPRVWAFGEALRRAIDTRPERVALIATGGLSHWPAAPESGRINEEFDREFLRRWERIDKAALLSYTDDELYRVAGAGAFEIRSWIALAAAARGKGECSYYSPDSIYTSAGVMATMAVEPGHLSADPQAIGPVPTVIPS